MDRPLTAQQAFGTRPAVQRYALALLGPALATGIGVAIGSVRTTSAALVYLLVVLPVVTFGGRGPGIVASVLSFLGLNFFFTPPRHTLSVSKYDDLVALVVFLSVAVLVAALTSIGNAERDRARRREYEARSLYALSTRLLSTDELDAVLSELVGHVRQLFDLDACEIRGQDGSGVLARSGEEISAGSTTVVEIPLQGASGSFGSLVLAPGRARFGEPERRVASILAQQLGAALERATLEREAREARVAAEAARVRQALLSAVSHDFRTPLSTIKAALTTLVPPTGDTVAVHSEEDIVELVKASIEETERLERLVSNLLDLTRLRSGSLAPSRVAISAQEVLEDALAASRGALGRRTVELKVRDDVPLIDVDPVQVGQVLRNVIENAVRYAPDGAPIRVTVSPWHDDVEVRVSDRGPGIPADQRDAVFEEFFRGGDDHSGGTGLGLAIARAIMRAHTGDIWVEETPGGGATLAMRFPASKR
jgi:two-component system sensor histidine kinase KdpD